MLAEKNGCASEIASPPTTLMPEVKAAENVSGKGIDVDDKGVNSEEVFETATAEEHAPKFSVEAKEPPTSLAENNSEAASDQKMEPPSEESLPRNDCASVIIAAANSPPVPAQYPEVDHERYESPSAEMPPGEEIVPSPAEAEEETENSVPAADRPIDLDADAKNPANVPRLRRGRFYEHDSRVKTSPERENKDSPSDDESRKDKSRKRRRAKAAVKANESCSDESFHGFNLDDSLHLPDDSLDELSDGKSSCADAAQPSSALNRISAKNSSSPSAAALSSNSVAIVVSTGRQHKVVKPQLKVKTKIKGTMKPKRPNREFCDQCGQGFPFKSGLKRHKLTHIVDHVREFVCKKCGKGFDDKAHLIRHEQKHLTNRPRPYECKKCRKGFFTASALKFHKLSCANKRLLKCPDCGDSFNRPDILAKHKLYCGDERGYPCQSPGCPEAFKIDKDLLAHQLVHVQEREFACPHCTATYRAMQFLNEHLQWHKPIKDEPVEVSGGDGKTAYMRSRALAAKATAARLNHVIMEKKDKSSKAKKKSEKRVAFAASKPVTATNSDSDRSVCKSQERKSAILPGMVVKEEPVEVEDPAEFMAARAAAIKRASEDSMFGKPPSHSISASQSTRAALVSNCLPASTSKSSRSGEQEASALLQQGVLESLKETIAGVQVKEGLVFAFYNRSSFLLGKITELRNLELRVKLLIKKGEFYEYAGTCDRSWSANAIFYGPAVVVESLGADNRFTCEDEEMIKELHGKIRRNERGIYGRRFELNDSDSE